MIIYFVTLFKSYLYLHGLRMKKYFIVRVRHKRSKQLCITHKLFIYCCVRDIASLSSQT